MAVCKNCPDRQIEPRNCHDYCEKRKKEIEEHQFAKQKLLEDAISFNTFINGFCNTKSKKHRQQ